MRLLVVAVVALAALHAATAQVVTGGRLPFSSRSNHRLPAAPVLSLGAVDVSAVSNEAPSREKPFTFAVAVPTELTTTNSGLWTDVEGGKVWRLTVSSGGATSLSVAFDHFDMPKGAELHIYDASKETIVGGFTKANVKPHRQFAVRPVAGDSLTLEYFQPAAVNGVPLFNITSVSHGVVDILKEYHDSGSCNVNVLCSLADNWRNQVRGVAMIMTTTGTRWCSGSMINNAKSDGRQLFLTANHCCQGQNPGKWMAVFNYDSPICDYASEKDGPLDQTATGMTLLSNNDYSDFCLLEIEEAIPKEYNVYLNGYEAVEQVPLTPFVIHHPSCDVKKISNSLYEVKSAGWGTSTGTSHWLVPQYNNGTTEPGSSGSPLFNEKQRIVGQLHGGEATCSYNYNDYYGKVSDSWAHGSGMAKQLQPFLDPDNKGTKTVDGRELYA